MHVNSSLLRTAEITFHISAERSAMRGMKNVVTIR